MQRVIARVGPERGVQPGGTVDAHEVDGVAGAHGEIGQMLELRAPVPYTREQGRSRRHSPTRSPVPGARALRRACPLERF